MGIYHSHGIAWILESVERFYEDACDNHGRVFQRFMTAQEFRFRATVSRIALQTNARLPMTGESFAPETFTGDFEIQATVIALQTENCLDSMTVNAVLMVRDFAPIS